MLKVLKKSWLDTCIAESAGKITAEAVRLTPELALELLGRNPDNRPVSKRRTELYASDITAGRWQANGEPIIVSRDGMLNDGQHRCHAVIAAGVAIPALIVFGVERETRTTTNQGKAKGASDYLAMHGATNANIWAAIARLTLVYEKTGNVNNARDISNSAIMEYIEDHTDEMLDSVQLADLHYKRLQHLVAPSPFGFCHYLCKRINATAAVDYFHAVATGEMIVSGDPAFAVRNKLASLGRTARAAKVEAILHGWNAFRRGSQRTMIRLTGELPELV